MKYQQAFIPLSALLVLLTASPVLARKAPFTGNWISLQYTNGKEFQLKLEQLDHELIGWEGKLPADLKKVPPDLKGTIKGKIADISVQHRRGYQAHAQLRLQGDKLVWQLMESDNRSSRYFPLASTLNRHDDDSPPESSQLSAINNSSDQPLWDILAQADAFEATTTAEAASVSPYFSSYKALSNRQAKTDDISLQALLKSSKPAARLYAAAIIWDTNQSDGIETFKTLSADNTPVQYKSGNDVIPSSVSEIAKSFVETGGYRDFPSKKY